MTKIGEGGVPPQPTEAIYHKQLQDGITHFENALNSYQFAKDDQEQAHLQNIMNNQMELINSAVGEIKRLGIYKQAQIVNKDFEEYKGFHTQKSLNALQQDLYTLREYNYQPETPPKKT
jgi:hypothetical protein